MRIVRCKLLWLLWLLGAVLFPTVVRAGATLAPEELHYKVMFKWGLIQKQAGQAVLSLSRLPDGDMRAALYARSAPWADRFYPLRDTLISILNPRTALPSRYERIAHEDGSYARDLVEFIPSATGTEGRCTRHRRRKGSDQISQATATLSANGAAVDMVSAFYYVRHLPFEQMTPGTARIINIFSGKKKELLRITYLGRETIKYDNRTFDTYKVSFTFTTDGRKQSSDDILTWLTADDRCIPVKLRGQLKIGRIECLLV